MRLVREIRLDPRGLAGGVVALILLSGPPLGATEVLSRAFTTRSDAGPSSGGSAAVWTSMPFTALGVAGDAPAAPPRLAYSPAFTSRSAAGSVSGTPLHLAFSAAFTLSNPLDVAAVPQPGFADPPLRYGLSPGVPNPFQSVTRVGFELPERARVRLQLFDVQGRRVRVLLDDVDLAPGRHSVVWDGLDGSGHRVSGGRYFCVLEAGRFRESRNLLLVR